MQLRGATTDLARAWGEPLLSGSIRRQPGDFRVNEDLGFEPEGDGPHVLLQVEKTLCNTMDAVKRLAAHTAAHPRDVGYSGLKDKYSVATQWFSVPWSAGVDWLGFEAPGLRVVRAERHRRKLRRGTHPANRFAVRVELDDPGAGDLSGRLERIRSGGVPNYFGAQRFGRHFAHNARRLAAGERLPRTQRSLTLSAIRSELFNRVLDRRVREGTWNRILPGEYVNLDGTRSGFPVEDDPRAAARVDAMDLHPTGPLAGAGAGGVRGQAAALEEDVIGACGTWCEVLAGEGLKSERRATRCRVAELEWRLEETVLVLGFTLRRGQFATSVLREVLDYRDVTRPAAGRGAAEIDQ